VEFGFNPHKLNTSMKTRYLKILHAWFFQFEFYGLWFGFILGSFDFFLELYGLKFKIFLVSIDYS